MISYIIMMMTIHRNNCVEKVLGVVVFHTFADDCTKPKKKMASADSSAKRKNKKTVMCAKGRKVTPNKSALLSLYIYTSAVGYVKMVFRFFLSLFVTWSRAEAVVGSTNGGGA